MSDGITGKASYECLSCGVVHFLHNEDFNFESESSSYREMGQETQYAAEFNEECQKCNNDIEIKFEVWEYPVGIINMTDAEISGAKVLDSDFGVYHEPPEDEYDQPIKLVKSLLQFRFDMFSELFVDFWISSYKKAPRPTSLASVLSLIIAIAGLYFSITTLDKVSKEKLDKRQSYAEQLTLLENTEKNLNDLSDFIIAKKSEIETTKILIKGLEEKKSELEPIVNANQKTVDAIFLQQKRELEEDIWTERGISFGLGILASLLASLIWHFVARFKKKDE
jgi:hypothetical protein